MTHTIFVPVSEFLQNGGVLNYGRSFCYQSGKEFGFYGKHIRPNPTDDTIEVVDSRTSRTFDENVDVIFVEINVTPIYK